MPFTEAHKYSCALPYKLSPGTHYWTFSYWKQDNCITYQYIGTYCYLQEHKSAPIAFTVAAPSAPSNAGLSSPADGATVTLTPGLAVVAPANAEVAVYVSSTRDRLSDGSPVSLIDSCSGATTSSGTYTCHVEAGLLEGGAPYYWWAVITVDGYGWIYGPRVFTVQDATARPSGGTARTAPAATLADAPKLRKAAQFRGSSVIETRLSDAVYDVTKYLGAPKMIDIACWSDADWPSVSGDSGDGFYSTLGIYYELMPHWIHLSPRVCRAVETLLHHRPAYPNRFTSDAVETITHEAMHALGITRTKVGEESEAMAECFGMQLSITMAVRLGVPYDYAERLAKINLANYKTRPASYRDYARCREDGAWDVFKGRPSPPWHTYG
jgi:hypothetical protein